LPFGVLDRRSGATLTLVAARSSAFLSGSGRPPVSLGLAVAVAAVALITVVLYPLGDVAPPVSLGVVYLLAVLLVSTYWGAGMGVLTGVASAASFNFFHLPPTGKFHLAEGEHWVALAVFMVAAVVASSVAEVARTRAADAERGRREADLAADLARLLLGTPDLRAALGPAAHRIAQALDLSSAAIVLGAGDIRDERHLAIPLTRDSEPIGSLRVPRTAPGPVLETLRDRVAPALEALLAAALDREALLREVVETRALRRSDEVKTAVLRAVSHDLRSPLTAIVAAGEALSSSALGDEDRRELAGAVVAEADRLSLVIDKLLDLSRLQAGQAEPRRDWCSIEEVLRVAMDESGAPSERFKVAIARDLPLIEADAAQLERAIANLLENALRYSGERPVSVRARVSGHRLLVRIVDQGPGIPLAEQERIFEPFYRGEGDGRHQGSGLGLAIVKGFVESNGGKVRVESLPGQGASFVLEFPLPAEAPAEAPAGAEAGPP
jgi:two-component system sensor histidine kinase KdpD